MTTPQYYYPPVDTHLIRSRHVAQTFKIQVMQPMRTRGQAERFPVVYATDGNLTFELFKGISQLIQSSVPNGSAPPFILVGIGYEGDCPLTGAVLRARDLTFRGYPELKITPPPIEGVAVAPEGTPNFRGADDFQRFIAEELFPLIDERYDTIPGDRTYFGHSGGGGFGLYTMLTRTEMFRNYLISSPGLIFHGKSSAGVEYQDYDFALGEVRQFLASGKSLDGIRMYLSVGTEEECEPAVQPWRLTSSFYRMRALLEATPIPGLKFMTEVFPGQNHSTVWPLAFMHGVQAAFGTGIWKGR